MKGKLACKIELAETSAEQGGEIVVPGDEFSRLDVFLTRHIEGGSRRRARNLIDARRVLVNGRYASKGLPLRPGDVVRIAATRRPRADGLTPQPDLPVSVLYEDAALIAVDKPAGMPSVALRLTDRDTVANFLAGRYPELRRAGLREVETGLAHRLDTGTSGILIAARSRRIYATLRRRFRERRVYKEYLALVAGDPGASGTIAVPIAHAGPERRRMIPCPNPARARARKARPAETAYRTIERFADTALLAVVITTGVRHQIRVHLASIGHPIIGDPLYGTASPPPNGATRIFLHAREIRLRHPKRGDILRIAAPVPADLRVALAARRSERADTTS